MLKTYLKSFLQQPYVYSPLSSERSIRVLTLHNASEMPTDTERIEFTIDECSLDSPCDYWALSYVCGDPRPVADVRVNERFFGVGRNLHAALRYIWLQFAGSAGGTLWENPMSTVTGQDKPRTLRLWIDAISISQGDTAEKARQVRLMKEIFEKAQRVVCWLGEHDEDFYAGYPKLREMTFWYDEVSAKLGKIGVNKYIMDNIADSGLLTYTNGKLDLEPWKALKRFFDRPYWRRTWILQECTTQAMTTYICGTTAIANRTFQIAEVVFLGFFVNRGFESLESVTGIEQIMRRTSFRRLRVESTQGVKLLQAMDQLREFEASDARDKVYACISVSDDASQLPIDYSLSVAEVYSNFFRFQTGMDRNLDVLGFVGKSIKPPAGLPSWVPDWTTHSKRRPFPKVLADQEHTKEHQVYHADCFCRSSNDSWEFEIKSNQLRLKGVFVDKIRVTTDMGSMSLFDVGAEYSWASFLGTGIYAPTRESWLGAYFRVLVADTCMKDGNITSRASEVEWPDELGFKDELLETMNRTGTTGSRKSNNMKEMTTKRCFAVTQAGYIGLVPSYAEVGDEIWVLVGGQVLYVLRDTGRKDMQCGKRIHEFLGEVYMHGLMDGEAGNLNRTVDDVIME